MSHFLSIRDWLVVEWRKNDLVHGLAMVLIVSLLSTILSALELGGSVDWALVGKAAVTAGMGYILKALGTNSQGELMKKDPVPGSPYRGPHGWMPAIVLCSLFGTGCSHSEAAPPQTSVIGQKIIVSLKESKWDLSRDGGGLLRASSGNVRICRTGSGSFIGSVMVNEKVFWFDKMLTMREELAIRAHLDKMEKLCPKEAVSQEELAAMVKTKEKRKSLRIVSPECGCVPECGCCDPCLCGGKKK